MLQQAHKTESKTNDAMKKNDPKNPIWLKKFICFSLDLTPRKYYLKHSRTI